MTEKLYFTDIGADGVPVCEDPEVAEWRARNAPVRSAFQYDKRYDRKAQQIRVTPHSYDHRVGAKTNTSSVRRSVQTPVRDLSIYAAQTVTELHDTEEQIVIPSAYCDRWHATIFFMFWYTVIVFAVGFVACLFIMLHVR